MEKEIKNYFEQFSDEVQARMLELRTLILIEDKNINEKMAYGMPAYSYLGKPFLYYGAFKNHLGFYATPSVHEHPNLQAELATFKQGRGSVQFPFNQELPKNLILKMIKLKKSLLDTELTIKNSKK